MSYAENQMLPGSYEGTEPELDEVAPVGELPVPALREPCPRCDGLGWLWEAHCRWSCVPALLTDAEYTDEFALLPCGHAVALASERACPRCQGQGVVGLEPDLAALGLRVPETLDEALVVIAWLIEEVARLEEVAR